MFMYQELYPLNHLSSPHLGYVYINCILKYYIWDILGYIKYGLLKNLLFKHFKNYYMCMSVVLGCMYICIPLTCLLLSVTRKGCWIPWNWFYGWLWAIISVLGIKPGSSVRTASPLDCAEPPSNANISFFFKLLNYIYSPCWFLLDNAVLST